MKTRAKSWTLLALLCCFPAWAQQEAPPVRWAAYYSDALPASSFESYHVVVFDGDHHPSLAPLKAHGVTLLGYLSAGEAERYRSYYPRLKAQKLLLRTSALWRDHQAIDLRNPAWEAMVVDELVPALLAQGFDGVMLDTLDSPLALEAESPEHYGGMRTGAVSLIKRLRERYPHIPIMLNRAFELLPEVGGDIDSVMAESIYTDWVNKDRKPKLLPQNTQDDYLRRLREAQATFPALKIYTLDYWNMKDAPGVKRIYAHQRGQGFIPYVATPELNRAFKEPE